MPKAAELARALNDFDPDSPPVAPETVRRWLHGLSMPELHRFRSLCAFLNFRPEELTYLLLLNPNAATAGPRQTSKASFDGVDQGRWNLREALQDLIASAQDDALSAAYIACLTAQSINTRRAGRASASTMARPEDDEKCAK